MVNSMCQARTICLRSAHLDTQPTVGRAGALLLLQLERQRGLRWAISAAAAYAALAATCDAYVMVGQLLAAHTLVLTLTGACSLQTLHRTYSVVYSLGTCACGSSHGAHHESTLTNYARAHPETTLATRPEMMPSTTS
jgi:hypothetical protein